MKALRFVALLGAFWYHDVVVIWPDGTANHTEWGAPGLVNYYGQFGTIDEVPASDKPKAELPR